MSDAIRNVTIRVAIEQQLSVLKAPDATAAKAAIADIQNKINSLDGSAFSSIAAAVNSTTEALSRQAVALSASEAAGRQNFLAMIDLANAETTVAKAATATAAAQRTMSVENINGAGNALRMAAASGNVADVVHALGQAFLFTAKGAAQQANASSTASLANAGLAATNVAVTTTGTLAARAMAFMSASLGPIAIGVAALSLVVQLGGDAWRWWAKQSRTANDDVQEAVEQRLAAEQQTAMIEQALYNEDVRRRGAATVYIEQQTEAMRRFRDVQIQISGIRSQAFDSRLSNLSDDPNTRLAALKNYRDEAGERALRSTGHAESFVRFGFGDGKNQLTVDDASRAARQAISQNVNSANSPLLDQQLKNEKDRQAVLQTSTSFIDRQLQIEKSRHDALRQNLQIEIQSRDTMKDRLRSIQDMIAAEQGRIQSAAERYAQMDPGEQARLKDVSLKAKQGGQLNLQEAQLLSQSGIGGGQASRAFEQIANKAGFQDVAGNLGEFDRIGQLRFQSKGIEEKSREMDARVRKAYEDSEKSLNSIGTMVDLLEGFGAKLAEVDGRVDQLKQDQTRKNVVGRQ